MGYEFVERGSEPRGIADRYSSVEFSVHDLASAYQFKIRDVVSRGTCVLVRQDSDLLHHVKVGDTLNLKYYPTDSTHLTEQLKTQIRYIGKDETGRFKGVYLVGLSLLEDRDSRDEELTRIVCPACATSYTIASKKIPQTRAVATCKMCAGNIVIEPRAARCTESPR